MKLKKNQNVAKIPNANKITRPMRRRRLRSEFSLALAPLDAISTHPVTLQIAKSGIHIQHLTSLVDSEAMKGDLCEFQLIRK